MQNYIDIAEKNGVILNNDGPCQFCKATTTRGVHECVELFSLGFQLIDYSNAENHFYRFLSVDAHTLQHPEIHGRWNNHFHLTRLHLIFKYDVKWTYQLSPKLSDHINAYKKNKHNEFLVSPQVGQRGNITTTNVLNNSKTEAECQVMIEKWARAVYAAWGTHHLTVDTIAKGFAEKHRIYL